MNRIFTASLLILSLLLLPPATGYSQGTIEEVRQYFELRDTISLMNLEMKRALAPDSQSQLLGDPDARSRLDAFLNFINSRIDSFAQLDTPLKYHYLKKLNIIFAETRQLHAVLLPRLRSVTGPVLSGASTSVTVVPAPNENIAGAPAKVHGKIYFDSIGMRTLAPAPSAKTASAVAHLPPRPDLVKTPVVVAPMPEPQPQPRVASAPNVPENAMTTRPLKELQNNIASTSSTAKPKSVTKENQVTAAASMPVVKPVEKTVTVATAPMPASATVPAPASMPVATPPSVPVAIVASASAAAPAVSSASSVLRPLAVMIENHNQSRPQSGLDQADIVYEMPVEGGITRFMAIYTRLPGVLGPVRSCREYFIDRALEIGALYVHCGGSPMGYAYISKSKINSIDEIKYGQPFYRDKTRKAPHNLYSKGQSLYDFMSEKISMRVATQPILINRGTRALSPDAEAVEAAKIRYHGNYTLDIKFENGFYQRYMNGVLHVDRESQQPLKASVVIIQVASMKTVDAAGRQEISFIGNGQAWVLESGRRTGVTWHKASPQSLTTYKDMAGTEYLFPRNGQIWVQVVSPIHKLSFNGEDEKPASAVVKPATASPTENLGKQG